MEWSLVTSQSSAIQLAALVLFAVVTIDPIQRFIRGRIERKRNPLPPGPTPLPLLGNALSINMQRPWLTYTAWKAKYGDVIYVRLLGTDVIVLNSRLDAVELLDKRSLIYSNRPSVTTADSYGLGGNIALAQYGPFWRLGRRFIHQTFRAESSFKFRPVQLRRARQMIMNIMDEPNKFFFHYNTFSSAVALSTIYDYEPILRGDPMVKMLARFTKAAIPALTAEMVILLKLFPFLLSVPTWIPGLSRIRRGANMARGIGTHVMETLYQMVQKRMASNDDIVSDTMVFHHAQSMEKMNKEHRIAYENALKQASFTSLLVVTDTTNLVLMTFTLAMVKNPRVWKRAQAEIDATIGTERLPEFEDRPSLSYVDAIIRESLRWIPVTPMGVPHAVATDDIYKGHHIPRGATVYVNIWSISHDETRYPDPEAFVPERFLNPEGKLNDDDPADFVFGFGRRICPGRYTADASLWSCIATMLATLDFNCIKDMNGNDIDFEAKFVNGLGHFPLPFPCNLTPRAHITREALQDLAG